jgi:flagellar protein FliS
MFGRPHHASNVYRRLAVESSALGADRHQLIALLLSSSRAAIAEARSALARQDILAKAAASTKAIRLVDEGLKFAVDRKVGTLGESLHDLYGYCAQRLMQAHLRNDDAAYAEVSGLLATVESAWNQIAPAPVATSGSAAAAGARVAA